MTKQILLARDIKPFTDLGQVVTDVPALASIDIHKLEQDLTTRSNYFTIAGMGNYAGARKIVFGTFRRNGNGTASLASWQED
jgi:hypothetical protein